MKLVRDSIVIGPLPQKYVPRSRIWFVPSSRTRNCSVWQSFPSPWSQNEKKKFRYFFVLKITSKIEFYRNRNIDMAIKSNHIIVWTLDEVAARWARFIKAQISKISQNANKSTRIDNGGTFVCIQTCIIITILEKTVF